jgi:two-component system OmpR family response regulator
MPRILVIEDDDVTAREIAAELISHGIDVDTIANGSEGLLRAADPRYDAITLDMMLPGMDGLSVVTQLRALGVTTPVLMISALCDVDERVRGLRAGGDDYLTKPFAPDEMLARVEVLLRRHRPQSSQTVLAVADLELDLVLTRTMIFETVWGFHFDPGTNLIDVHIGRLRRKIDVAGLAPLIHTVRGSGYSLAQND